VNFLTGKSKEGGVREREGRVGGWAGEHAVILKARLGLGGI